jgi:hypothetical protein
MHRILVALVCCAVAASSARGEQPFPYKAYINGNDVHIRSGPGQSYYPTDKLKLGQEVEVYRHDPGGWYAIKPVEDSFSWVSAKYLKREENGLAVVAEEEVSCRVGSRFSDIRDVIQVRLHRGEVVEVLDSKQAGAVPEAKGWYKIAPPAGEFRWVFGKYVDPEYPHDGLRKTADGAAGRGDGEAGEDAAGSSAAVAAAQHGKEHRRRASAASRPASAQQFQPALEAIDLELSTMVSEEPTVWTFDTLRPRTESLLNQAETALQRGRARWLLSRINRFADIKERYDAIAALQEETERSSRELAGLSPRQRQADRDVELAGRFDGVGRLVEISTPKFGAPRFALVDERGDVRCYVSPALGVNLRYYVGRQVGVNGTRGYMPEQRAQHLLARHISLVDDRTLR